MWPGTLQARQDYLRRFGRAEAVVRAWLAGMLRVRALVLRVCGADLCVRALFLPCFRAAIAKVELLDIKSGVLPVLLLN